MLDYPKTHAERPCGPDYGETQHVDLLRELWKLRHGRLILALLFFRRALD